MRDIGMSIPEFFTCPISLELFKDPVTLCTGQTYDRPFIERWLAAGNLTCPVTMQKLHDLSMVPNHTLGHLIDQWLSKGSNGNYHHHHHHHHHHHYHDDGDDIHDYGDFCKVGSSNKVFFSSLQHGLESQDSSMEKKIQVLEQVICLLEDLPRKNESLIQMGFFSLVLGLVFGAKYTQEMLCLIEKSLDCALKLLPFSYLGDLNMLMEEPKFENFKVLLQEGSVTVKKALCNIIVIVSLQTSSTTKELLTKIGNDHKILKTLIGFVDDHQQNDELSKVGIKTILSLLLSSSQHDTTTTTTQHSPTNVGTEEGRMYATLPVIISQHDTCPENLVKGGLVGSLVNYIMEVEMKKDRDDLGPKAIKALELVLVMESAKEAFLANEVLSKGIKALIKMVFRVSGDDMGSESAVNCLMILCCESMEVREEAICGGLLTQLLLLLQSQCSVRTKTRARMLLKLLRSMWSKDPKHV